MPDHYKDAADARAPNWGDAEGWFGKAESIIGMFVSVFAEAAAQAIRVRFFSEAPADALPYIGKERDLERAPGETTAQYRERLRLAFDAYAYAGTEKAIKDQLAVFGYTNVTVYESEDWYPGAAEWWRFWVVIDLPHDFTAATSFWDAVSWDGFTWDFTGDGAARVCRVICKWKSAHSKLVSVIVVHSGSLWDHSFTWDSSTWDGAATTFGCSC